MEPVTINLEGLSEFGPFGYLIGHTLAALFFGIIAFRHSALAGKCKGEGCRGDRSESEAQGMVANSHIWRAAISGFLGLANAVAVIVMSVNLFVASLEKANAGSDSQTATTLTANKPQFNGPYTDELCEHFLSQAKACKQAQAVKNHKVQHFVNNVMQGVGPYASAAADAAGE